MVNIKVLGSSSKGNCYILEDGEEKLIIELGVNWKEVVKGLNYDICGVVGALVSHRHGDHAKYIQKAIDAGITVYGNSDLKEMNHCVSIIPRFLDTKVGNFTVSPFEAVHDVPCFGYIIKTPNNGTVVFSTDTCCAPPIKVKHEHYLIEANYSDEIMEKQAMNMTVSIDSKMRLDESHLSLEKAVAYLKEVQSDNLKTVVLLHLSERNSDTDEFVKKVRDELKFPNVMVAKSNTVIKLDMEGYF